MTANDSVEEKSGIIDKILGGLKDIFAPVLIALSAAGILQGVTILLNTFGIIQEGTAEYIILDTIGGAVFYFLPILLASSSAKVFDANPTLAMCAAFFLVHPTVTQTFESGYTLATFFGIPLPPGNYPSSVIPIILIVWAQHYIEKFWNKIVPEIIRGVIAPMFILVTTVLIGIAFLGPIGTFLGQALLGLIGFLNGIAGWLPTTLLGGFGLFVVMVGAHYSLFPVVMQTLASQGVDTFFNPGMLASNVAIAGAVFAVLFKTKNSSYRQYSVSAVVTALLGVSQPALYGVAIPFKRVLVASIIGGLAGGFYAGISQFYAYAFVNPGLAAFPAYIAPDGSMGNIINAVITILISFVVPFLIVYFSKFEDMPEEEINKITAEDN